MVIDELDQSKLYSPLMQQRANNILNTKGNIADSNGDITNFRVKDTTFVDALKSFIKDVDNQQKESNDMTERFIKGEPVDLHDVMISAEKAKTTFTLMMEMRNKFLDLYREAMRMQV